MGGESGYQGTRLLNNLSSLVTNPIITPVTNTKLMSGRDAPLENNSQLQSVLMRDISDGDFNGNNLLSRQ